MRADALLHLLFWKSPNRVNCRGKVTEFYHQTWWDIRVNPVLCLQYEAVQVLRPGPRRVSLQRALLLPARLPGRSQGVPPPGPSPPAAGRQRRTEPHRTHRPVGVLRGAASLPRLPTLLPLRRPRRRPPGVLPVELLRCHGGGFPRLWGFRWWWWLRFEYVIRGCGAVYPINVFCSAWYRRSYAVSVVLTRPCYEHGRTSSVSNILSSCWQ